MTSIIFPPYVRLATARKLLHFTVRTMLLTTYRVTHRVCKRTSLLLNNRFLTGWSPREEKKCEIRFFSISLPACGKRNFFEGFPFSHVEREEIFLNLSFHMKKKSRKNEFLSTKMSKISEFLREEKRFFSHFSLRKKIFFNFPFRMWKGKKLSSHFSSQRSPWFLIDSMTIIFLFQSRISWDSIRSHIFC